MVSINSVNKELYPSCSRIVKAESVSIKKLILITVFAVFAISAKAQFTYVTSGFSYELTTYMLNYNGATAHHNLKWNIGGMWRPRRALGIGASVGIPLFRSTNFTFEGSPTDGDGFYNFDTEYGAIGSHRYVPDLYEYEFIYSPSINFVMRLFFSGENTAYFDLKVSYLNSQENFRVERAYLPLTYYYNSIEYEAVEELKINYTHKHNVIIPGAALGLNKPVSKRLSIDMNMGLDFLFYADDPFKFKIPYGWDFSNYKENNVTLTSKAEGFKPMLSISFNLNYSF